MARGRVREVRLVRAPSESWVGPARFDPAQTRVVDHDSGVLRVLGGPGTGKTTVLEAAAARRITDGADPSSVLVLTFGRRAAAAMRDGVIGRVGTALREPPVRSVQSYAFAVLTRAHERRDWERPRLITGPEQDMIIRELVEGALAGAGAVRWPDRLRAALPTRGFATELRDALMRCTERGVTAAQLAGWGERHGRADWVAVAQFMREFSGVAGLSTAGSYDPAELVRAVLDSFASDPALLAAERERIGHLYVDEAQDLDPAQAELIELVAGGAASYVVAGDPDQSVFGFRGADPQFLVGLATQHGADTVVLPTAYRSAPAVLDALRAQSARLPGIALQRQSSAPSRDDWSAPSRVEVAGCATEAREASVIAHRLRAAHLLDGVPWSQMAVVVRSVAAALPALRRAFIAAEVPLTVAGHDVPVADSPAVRGLLDLVTAALRPQTLLSEQLEHILTSAYVGLDALGVRRIRRALRAAELASGGTRSSTAILRDCLVDPRELLLADRVALRPLHDLAALLGSVSAAARSGGDPEQILYSAWTASGVQRPWRQQALGGGPHAGSADARLDAVVAMFDAVATFVERLPAADVFQFMDYLAGQELAADRLSASTPDDGAVRVVTAQTAKGQEWDLVVVPGLQEGRWPNLIPRGSLLGSETLVDIARGIDPTVALSGRTRATALLAEERRMFYVACSRARRWLLVTARDGLDERPSRFFEEIQEQDGVQSIGAGVAGSRRGLSIVDTVAELRAVAVDPRRDQALRESAAECLADFMAARVPGAGPDDWYGVGGPSDQSPLYAANEPVPVSPSKVETFTRCQLRWLLERVGGGTNGLVAASVGTLVHDALESLGDTDGRSSRQIGAALQEYVDARWVAIGFDAAWEGRREQARVAGMVEHLATWLAANPREFLGAEVPFSVEVGRAVLAGKLDRIERDADGRVVVVDLKTGKNPLTRGKVPDNPQLGTYQLAVEQDALQAVTGPSVESGGAELLYVSNALRVLSQAPLAESGDPGWAHRLVGEVAEAMAGAQFVARDGDLCQTCPVRTSCPAQPEGRQVSA